MGEENKTRDTVDAVTGLVKAVPVYEDVVQPAAKEIGAGLQTVAKTVHIALAPISALVWGFDQIKEFVGTSVAKRLEKIPPEQIITPLPQIAGPALEALKYTGHDENLREMFAKLLATAMDKKTATHAHPSFVEIIRQLSSDEAKICKLLKQKKEFPAAHLIEFHKDENFFRLMARHLSIIGKSAFCDCSMPKTQQYIDNLIRLRIIETEYSRVFPIDESSFAELKNNPHIHPLISQIIAAGRKPGFQQGHIFLTSYGDEFLSACID